MRALDRIDFIDGGRRMHSLERERVGRAWLHALVLAVLGIASAVGADRREPLYPMVFVLAAMAVAFLVRAGMRTSRYFGRGAASLVLQDPDHVPSGTRRGGGQEDLSELQARIPASQPPLRFRIEVRPDPRPRAP